MHGCRKKHTGLEASVCGTIAGLQMFISFAHQAYCYDFVSDWMHSEDAGDTYVIAEHVESELKLTQRFMKLQVANLVDTETFQCVGDFPVR